MKAFINIKKHLFIKNQTNFIIVTTRKCKYIIIKMKNNLYFLKFSFFFKFFLSNIFNLYYSIKVIYNNYFKSFYSQFKKCFFFLLKNIFFRKKLLMFGEKFICKIWNNNYLFFKLGFTHTILIKIPFNIKVIIKKTYNRLRTLFYIYGINRVDVENFALILTKLRKHKKYRKMGIYDLRKKIIIYTRKLK